MSLANVLAVSQAARSLVLLGDPQQLEQPRKGSHPDGVDVSALEHILGDEQTMPSDRGIFLPVTWRLAPSICDFTSEVFYEGRLDPRAGLERQRIVRRRAACRRRPVGARRRARRQPAISRPKRSKPSRRSSQTLIAPGVDVDRQEGQGATARRNGRAGRRAVQRAGQPPARSDSRRSTGRARRNGRQVPGAGGAGRHLLDGDVAARGRAARDGVSLQPESAERRDVAGALSRDPRGVAAPLRAGVPNATPDAARERALPIPGDGDTDRLALSAAAERSTAALSLAGAP